MYGYVENDTINAFDTSGLDAEITVNRMNGRSGPSDVTVVENGKVSMQFTGNPNPYEPGTRGIPAGDYVLLPKPESQMYPVGDPGDKQNSTWALRRSLTRNISITPDRLPQTGKMSASMVKVPFPGAQIPEDA